MIATVACRSCLEGISSGTGIANNMIEKVFQNKTHDLYELAKTNSLVAQDVFHWDALDEQDVTFVIMLEIPAAEGGTTHLQILSALSGKLMDEDFRNHLMNANQKETILNLLDELVVQKTN
ncbi:PTS sugar transporter subunit IIA [Bacillus taeanensis]|uniref:PTS sugar transporter subunit IIA n=1 Tax=Bacillus taeanensis TaxID=273032 RepID=UPI001FEB2921|nr:PTS sugar transporter subunit IIA [Bacillus taeanensis]